MGKVIRDPAVLERMEMTFELYELAETMQRQNIRRRHPELSPREVEKRVDEWLVRRPPGDRLEDEPAFRRRRPRD